jgi:hypothetical protein
MRPISFGSYDFTAAGVEVIGFEVQLNSQDSGLIRIPRADGAYDGLGSAQSSKQPGSATIRFEVYAAGALTVDDQVDAFLQQAQKGLQWLRALKDDDATYRRLLAKCTQIAAPVSNNEAQFVREVTATFEIAEPYWYGDSQVTDTFAVSATPRAIDINNTGTAPLIRAILTFTGTCNRPKFLNNTNGYSIEVNQNISTSKTVEIDLGAQTVTVDSVSAWGNVVLPSTQIGLFKWDVGVNDVDFIAAGGGTPSGSVQIVYRLMYH